MNSYDMNGVCAVITGGGQGLSLGVASRLVQSGAKVSLWSVNKDVLGLRLESFILDLEGIPVEALDIEPTEAELQVLVRSERLKAVIVLRERLFMYQPEERIHVSPVAGAMNLFDAESDLRISPECTITTQQQGNRA